MIRNKYIFTGRIIADEFEVDDLVVNNIDLPITTLTGGQIKQNGVPVFQTFGGTNLFVGPNAGNLTLTGANNVGIGATAAHGLTSGSRNTALGVNSLINLITGTDNTTLGFSAGSAYTGAETGNILIGSSNFGTVGDSHVIRIGSASTSAFIQGINGVDLAGPGNIVGVTSLDKLGTVMTVATAGAANINTNAAYQISLGTVLDINAGKTRLSAGTGRLTLDSAANVDISSSSAFITFAGNQSLSPNFLILRNVNTVTSVTTVDTFANTYLFPNKPGPANYTLATTADLPANNLEYFQFPSTSGILLINAAPTSYPESGILYPGTNLYTATSITYAFRAPIGDVSGVFIELYSYINETTSTLLSSVNAPITLGNNNVIQISAAVSNLTTFQSFLYIRANTIITGTGIIYAATLR